MQSKATTIVEYLDSLPPDRRIAIKAVRKAIVDNLDPDYFDGAKIASKAPAARPAGKAKTRPGTKGAKADRRP